MTHHAAGDDRCDGWMIDEKKGWRKVTVWFRRTGGELGCLSAKYSRGLFRTHFLSYIRSVLILTFCSLTLRSFKVADQCFTVNWVDEWKVTLGHAYLPSLLAVWTNDAWQRTRERERGSVMDLRCERLKISGPLGPVWHVRFVQCFLLVECGQKREKMSVSLPLWGKRKRHSGLVQQGF